MLAIHTESKTRFHPSLVSHVLRRAARNIVGTESTVGVYADERCVGLVRGESGSRRVRVKPITHKQWCGFNDQAAIEAAVRAGKIIEPVFNKVANAFNSVNVWGDLWPVGFYPQQGTYGGTAATARQLDQTTPGAFEIRHKTPGAGETRHFMGAHQVSLQSGASTAIAQEQWLYDRTLQYDGCTITTSTTTMTNTITAARHISAGEDGLQICVTGVAALGATASNLTSVVIVDNAGNTAVSLTPGYTMPWWTNGLAGASNALAPVVVPHDNGNTTTIAPWLPMPPGVRGCRSVTSFASSANNTGTVAVTLIKPIAFMWTSAGSIVHNHDSSRLGFQMGRVYDSACLNLLLRSFFNNGGATFTNFGQIRLVHG
jgi:hypothetical protein